MGDKTKKVKKPKIDIPREEYENQTPKEREAYNQLVREMDEKIKKASEEAKNRPFNKGGKVKGYEHGGSVKGKGKCKIDGIAIRGKTRAKRK
jgi:hypothetical protein